MAQSQSTTAATASSSKSIARTEQSLSRCHPSLIVDETDINSSTQKPPRPRAKPSSSLSPSPSISSSYTAKPISSHYALNNRILAAFDSLYEQQLFRGAYAYGLQFVEVALLEIPTHGYFYAPKHESERLENAQNAWRVADQLEQILSQGLLLLHTTSSTDSQRGNRTQHHPSELERISKFKLLAQEELNNIHDKQQQPKNKYRERVEVESFSFVSADSNLCGDLLEYANMCCIPNSSSAWEHQKQQQTTASRDDLERALFVSGIAPPNTSTPSANTTTTHLPTSTATLPYQHQPSKQQSDQSCSSAVTLTTHSDGARRIRSVSAIDIASLQLCYHEDFDELRRRGQVRISRANTYQGRLPGSVNGCTVIAPLLCLHHFCNTTPKATTVVERGRALPIKLGDDDGLPDAAIIQVIDEEAPSILPQVRSKLGLTKNALIIPQDVHDFFIDKELLTTEQFVTVVGGNVLDDGHIEEFIKHLTSTTGNGQGKLAATFFFHDHVIAILCLHRAKSGDVWFDVIDSLPNQETLRRVDEEITTSTGCGLDYVPYASRIRCLTIEALKATIRWFACSRFTDDNKQYLDMYDWDDAHSDFDPRVFQAFVWRALVED